MINSVGLIDKRLHTETRDQTEPVLLWPNIPVIDHYNIVARR